MDTNRSEFELHTREYWEAVVNDIEEKTQKNLERKHIQCYDYASALPEHLRKRVKKILSSEYDELDLDMNIEESIADLPKEKEEIEPSEEDSEPMWKKREKDKKKAPFNESTCSEIERMENEFPNFDVKIEAPPERAKKVKKSANWFTDYVCQPRKERVKWNSKIYDMNTEMEEKNLDEQAEMLMDASAERFTEWLNNLGSTKEGNITKEKLKELFSIEGDKRLFASIQTDPVEVKAIAKTVADKWNLPEMAIELKYENYINNLLKNVPKKVVKVAFGRTVPEYERPWLPSARNAPITTVYPEDLRSGEKLFKGITHLRSTKSLVEFLRARPWLEKPKYLVDCGSFKQKAKVATKQDVPLYELLKLKY